MLVVAAAARMSVSASPVLAANLQTVLGTSAAGSCKIDLGKSVVKQRRAPWPHASDRCVLEPRGGKHSSCGSRCDDSRLSHPQRKSPSLAAEGSSPTHVADRRNHCLSELGGSSEVGKRRPSPQPCRGSSLDWHGGGASLTPAL